VDVIIMKGRDISRRITHKELGMFRDKINRHIANNSQLLWINPPGQHNQGLVVIKDNLKHKEIGHRGECSI
jgi:hypothetical protein